MVLKINIKKMHPDAIIPKYAKDGDAGLDLVATTMNVIREHSTGISDKVVYGTGLAFEIPKGYVGLLFPRSSVSKKHLTLANSVGVLDSGYRGEVSFVFKKDGWNQYDVGDRIGQIIIIPHPEVEFKEVDELSETERGEGGFGSTGK